ncbi:uncharacterized protein LOC120771222 isoform X3 [Bactrocera tryoni]|uniref:uncharacterized protein LOC120771222 isoform X3 n=1 Tax=Bactrocera tryoni TaxID=59916 RepID=UPI001A969486|nr:uncharacterized protein LOC120771222 isoform X3 [Bactrocera tryoni]
MLLSSSVGWVAFLQRYYASSVPSAWEEYMKLSPVNIIVNILELNTLRRRKHNLLLPWTIETLFNLGLTLLLYLRDAQFSWISLIVLVLNLYFWYAMVSLYGKIREGNERRSNRNVNV